MPEYKKYRIYLSSTFRDLQKHRERVIGFFHNLSDRFDIEYMERYVADGRKALPACLEGVRDCDIYILLVGRRCGWIPGEDPADGEGQRANPDQLSITNLEFNAAAEKTRLVFRCDPLDESLPQDPPDELFAEKQEKLTRFRKQVEREGYLQHSSFFTTDENLTVQVAEAIISCRKDILLRPQERSKLIKPEHRYCCDRTVQFNEYWSNSHCDDYFKTYLIYGQRAQAGGNFIKRIGFFNLNFTINLIDYQGLMGGKITPEKLRSDVLILLLKAISPVPPAPGHAISPADILRTAWEVGQPYFAVKIILEEPDYWAVGFGVLKTLFAEFSAACREFRKVKMIWFIQVQDIDVEPTLTVGLDALKSCFHVLSELTPPRMSHLRTWLREYISDDDTVVANLESTYFSRLTSSPVLLMGEVETEMGKFIKKMTLEDPELFTLLNPQDF